MGLIGTMVVICVANAYSVCPCVWRSHHAHCTCIVHRTVAMRHDAMQLDHGYMAERGSTDPLRIAFVQTPNTITWVGQHGCTFQGKRAAVRVDYECIHNGSHVCSYIYIYIHGSMLFSHAQSTCMLFGRVDRTPYAPYTLEHHIIRAGATACHAQVPRSMLNHLAIQRGHTRGASLWHWHVQNTFESRDKPIDVFLATCVTRLGFTVVRITAATSRHDVWGWTASVCFRGVCAGGA